MIMEKSQAKPSTSNGADVDDAIHDSTSPCSLSIFHEDVLLSILSFVADVPYELQRGDDGELPFLVVLISCRTALIACLSCCLTIENTAH